jgi:hypothetical protein
LGPAPSLIADLPGTAEQDEVVEAVDEVVEAVVEKATALRQTALGDLGRRADIAGGDPVCFDPAATSRARCSWCSSSWPRALTSIIRSPGPISTTSTPGTAMISRTVAIASSVSTITTTMICAFASALERAADQAEAWAKARSLLS